MDAYANAFAAMAFAVAVAVGVSVDVGVAMAISGYGYAIACSYYCNRFGLMVEIYMSSVHIAVDDMVNYVMTAITFAVDADSIVAVA